ncbi:hypothetical protein IMSAG049_00780 [Clostridiales bacterium]|nr:hypothetical protein IMSAG049_00780 [Clostridiales bacterium]
MDLGFLESFAVPMIVGICLCVGYMIKNFIPPDTINKYIPLIMGFLGVALNTWINGAFTAEILLGGLFSGLASTGLYEMFRNLIGGEKK